MADTGVNAGERTRKKTAKLKLSKLFHRKKRYSEFGSKENIVDNLENAENDGSLASLAENGVGEDQNSGFRNNKKGQSLFKSERHKNKKLSKKKHSDKRATASHAAPGSTEGIAVVQARDSQGKSEESKEKNKENRSRTTSQGGADCTKPRTASSAGPEPDIEVFRNNDGEKASTESSNRQPSETEVDGGHKITHSKSGKSGAFTKLKRKLHLSNYKELSEVVVSDATANIADNEGYENIKKKKRLKQTGKSFRKALRTGLRSFADGFQNLSPMTAAYSANTYYSTDGKNYNPYFTRTKPNVINLFI